MPAVIRPEIAALSHLRRPDYVFFDERFPQAHGAAAALSGCSRLLAVQSDITALWRDELAVVICRHPLHLYGVTTHSFLFCLRVLVAEQADLKLQVGRLDQNLLRWTMRTIPEFDQGVTRNG
ncbi:MAG: hypothetical protein JOY91_13770 [Sinobacteraceae bacterium]|nr:hypothetical protein [Nevskiaceae bacterium]